MQPCQLRIDQEIKHQLERLKQQLEQDAPTSALDFLNGYLLAVGDAEVSAPGTISSAHQSIAAILRAAVAE